MDNKLNKKRLSDFFSYEWIIMIIAAAGFILLWEIVYTMTSVRLTVGQEFKFYYDEAIYSENASQLYNLLTEEDAFSYDVLEVSFESLTSDFNVLSVRLSIQEGDMIITDDRAPAEDADDKTVRARTLVDSFSVYTFDKLLSDAKAYLSKFTADGTYDGTIDEEKTEAHFRERMKRDNRFRSEEQKEEGAKSEAERIKKLQKETLDFEKILLLDDDYFFKYTRYEQSLAAAENDDRKNTYSELIDREKEAGRENARYGLNAGMLSGGKHTPSEYFKVSGSDNADNVVIMAFDFLNEQPDLQFECISFINTIVRACSNLLD